MAINESVYGAKNTWLDSAFNRYITNKNKVANFGNNSSRLQNGVSNNKLTYESPIDKSLSYCGLGAESALSHIGYIYKQNGSFSVREWQDNVVTNFAFFQQNSTEVYMAPSPDNCYFEGRTIYKTLAWQNDRNGDNKNQYLQPYVLINPQNQVLCIYIQACNNAITDFRDVPMAIYLSTYKTTHPLIINVYLRAFFNNQAWTESNPVRTISGDMENSLNGNQLTLSYGRLDNYRCEGKNFDIYSYYLNNCTIMGSSSFSSVTKYDDKMLFVMATEACKSHVHIFTTGGDNDYLNVYIEYFSGIEEEILKTVACFGLYFTPSENVAKTGKLTNNDMYIGILGYDGVGHGNYLRGADTVQAPQNNWNDMSEAEYDPSKPIDPNTYSDSTPFTLTTGSTSSIYPYYIDDTARSILSAMEELTNMPDPGNNSWIFNRSFLFQEPIECIVSWRRVHCKTPILSPNKSNIVIGWFRTENDSSKAYTSSAEVIREKIFETTIWKRYDNFLDYEPYTRMALYFPFCGMKELPLATFMGHKIELYSSINRRTGEIEVIICVDEKQWGNMTGNCSEELQLSANKSIEYIKTKLQLQQRIDDTALGMATSILGNAAGATISATHGNFAGALIQAGSAIVSGSKGIEDVANLEFQLNHLPNKIVNLQKGSPTIQVCDYLYPYILIQRPVLMNGYNSELYGKTTGFATLENRMKSSLKGYTEATNPILDGISCTETERNMIIKALQEGCIFDE